MNASAIELVFPAHARYLSLARLGLAGVAPVARLDATELADLKLAVTEACANAVRHAYPSDDGGDVRVTIEVAHGAVVVEVADSGRGIESDELADWDPDDLHEEGMGLAIIRSVMDEVEIAAPIGGGTVVRLVKRVGAPTHG
jgi:serine/threonine-protein kinase RsbW